MKAIILQVRDVEGDELSEIGFSADATAVLPISNELAADPVGLVAYFDAQAAKFFRDMLLGEPA